MLKNAQLNGLLLTLAVHSEILQRKPFFISSASSCMVYCNFIRGVDQGLVCYFADFDATQLILFNEK